MTARVLWPERFPLVELMRKLASEGEGAFNTEQQNLPYDPGACEWPPEYFERADFWFDQWPTDLAVKTMALDPSKGKDAKRGDYSAIIKYGAQGNRQEYVEGDLKVRTVDVMCGDAARICAEFRPEVFVLEGNAWQDLLAAPLQTAFEREGIYEQRIILVNNQAPKPVRIRRWTVPLATKRIRFKSRSPGTAIMVKQMREFPFGDHDDGPDGGEMARTAAIELVTGKIERKARRR